MLNENNDTGKFLVEQLKKLKEKGGSENV